MHDDDVSLLIVVDNNIAGDTNPNEMQFAVEQSDGLACKRMQGVAHDVEQRARTEHMDVVWCCRRCCL